MLSPINVIKTILTPNNILININAKLGIFISGIITATAVPTTLDIISFKLEDFILAKYMLTFKSR